MARYGRGQPHAPIFLRNKGAVGVETSKTVSNITVILAPPRPQALKPIGVRFSRNPLEPPPPPPFVRPKITVVLHTSLRERQPGSVTFLRNPKEQLEYDDRGPGSQQIRHEGWLDAVRRRGEVRFTRNTVDTGPPPPAFAPAVRIHVISPVRGLPRPAHVRMFRAPDLGPPPPAAAPAQQRIHVVGQRARSSRFAVPLVTFIRNAPAAPAAPGDPESDNRLWQDIFQWTNLIR